MNAIETHNPYSLICAKQNEQRKKQAGITFAEVLASMVFVAILLPVALEGVALANKAGIVADRKKEATQLADLILNEMILTEQWQYGNNQGDFGEERPGYRWMLSTENWDVDSMLVVTVTVIFEVQEQDYYVQLSTLVDKTEE